MIQRTEATKTPVWNN